MKDNLFIDSNIFLYAFDSSDILKQEIASSIISINRKFKNYKPI